MSWDREDLVEGPVPLWFQIAERLRTAVEKAEFSEGEALPSESALGARFGVSRTTARAALDSLESDGLISRRSGRGSVVLPPRVTVPPHQLASFTEDMRARGLEPSYGSTQVSVEAANGEPARALGVPRRTKLVRIERVLLADGSPIAVSTSWLSPDIVTVRTPPTPAELSGSLYDWLERTTGTRLVSGRETIAADVADADLAERLGVPAGSPVLTAVRVASDVTGRAVEYADRRYRADRYRFTVDSVRS
ncbi:GntR family transcriptional regulator [Saccharomonospora sp. NPDC006951]